MSVDKEIKIGSSLKRFRKTFNLTQDTVADAIGISRPLYTKYECDKNMPAIDTIMKIAMEFGVPVDYLVGLSDEPHPPKFDEKTLNLLRAMDAMYSPKQATTQ